ncbi:putative membrane protein [Methanobacterium formicicum]|uniref:Membrane protein n=2 Tax=Methanobacterium formicicum TaxID=2162 RepID=A0A0S4FT36_METFO|nr:putative membrane protein [Methanobacterium formicicum]
MNKENIYIQLSTEKMYINKKTLIGGKNMSFLKDEGGQGAAEYILLFGGVIVIAIAALLIYRAYFTSNSGLVASSDVNTVRNSMNTPQ